MTSDATLCLWSKLRMHCNFYIKRSCKRIDSPIVCPPIFWIWTCRNKWKYPRNIPVKKGLLSTERPQHNSICWSPALKQWIWYAVSQASGTTHSTATESTLTSVFRMFPLFKLALSCDAQTPCIPSWTACLGQLYTRPHIISTATKHGNSISIELDNTVYWIEGLGN
jgi:hypothetical protein